MLKKFLLFALFALPAVTFAQESKIAYVNRLDIIFAMPEYAQMMDSLTKSEKILQNDIKEVNDELMKKYTDYVAQRDSLSENIRLIKEKEIDDFRQRLENFQQFAQQKQDELQQALIAPILNKFQKAVDDVGRENNFLYILDSQMLTFTSTNATNATPLIRKKLGLQ